MKKIYLLTIVIVLTVLTMGGWIILNPSMVQQLIPLEIIPNSDSEKAIAEPATARIDVMASPYSTEQQFVVYANDTKPLEEASWMTKYNFRGYTIQKDGNDNMFIIKPNNDVNIDLVLRGKWEQDVDKNMVERWVDFTSITVNGVEILPQTISVWYNKPFKYILHAKAGEIYDIVAKWQKHKEFAE
ncbi:MAG: hypothetical protein J6Y85_03835 [Alphaproteobacteria bacterium]|nr:hypothetical protein [Alphaproteobacteria bacterium]